MSSVSSFFLYSSFLQSLSKNKCHQQQWKKRKTENRDNKNTCNYFRFEYEFVYKRDIPIPLHRASFLLSVPSVRCPTLCLIQPRHLKSRWSFSASPCRSAIEEADPGADLDPDEWGIAKAEADDANSVHGDLKESILMNSLRWRWSANENSISMHMTRNWDNSSFMPTVKNVIAVNVISKSVAATLRSNDIFGLFQLCNNCLNTWSVPWSLIWSQTLNSPIFPMVHNAMMWWITIVPKYLRNRGDINEAIHAMDDLPEELNHGSVYTAKDAANWCLIELAQGGDVFGRLSKLNVYKETDARTLAKFLLLIVGFIHSKNYVHRRDLKPENLLLKFLAEDSNGLMVADFGFSKMNPSGRLTTSWGCVRKVCGKYAIYRNWRQETCTVPLNSRGIKKWRIETTSRRISSFLR